MPPYRGPENGIRFYIAKFIRVGNQLVVTPPDDTSTSHFTLANQDGIHNDINRLRQQDPSAVDAGLFIVSRDSEQYGGDKIIVNHDSSTLRLPASSQAREITIATFRQQGPGFTVIPDANMPPIIYPT